MSVMYTLCLLQLKEFSIIVVTPGDYAAKPCQTTYRSFSLESTNLARGPTQQRDLFGGGQKVVLCL